MHTHLLFELTIILYIYGLHRRRFHRCNLSVLYNTREEAAEAKLETAFARGAFKRSTFHSKITIKTSQCRSIA